MSDIAMLMEMGFPKEKAEYAIKVTNNKGVEPAMEWLLAHVDEEIPKETTVRTTKTTEVEQKKPTSGDTATSCATEAAMATAATATKTVKSLKCDDCGKLCKDEAEVTFHAAKTGHTNFSESTEEKKPLTEEEKKYQLALIEEKLKLKRIEREEREKADALEREKNRIKSGKDMAEARKRLEELEMKKLVEQRKREKAEEKAARERVRAQIEADKQRRKACQQQPVEPAASSTKVTPSTTNNLSKMPNKEYTQTRIQIRLQDGSTLTETFNVKEQLSAVRVFIQMKTGNDTPFGLMTTFPRTIFSYEDFEKPLDVLGLVPSAVLIMTKTPNT